jgi:DnaJ-domain-containing protein 1
MDYFTLLGFDRTPWLDPADVHKRFLELSAAVHPDRVHHLGAAEKAEANRRFAELNKAATTLKDHKERLHHLIALETGATPAATQNIPNDLIELFGKIGSTCRSVDQFLAEKSKAISPMLQAQMFAKTLEWSDAVTELQQLVAVLKTDAETKLKEIAHHWPTEKPMDQIATLAHGFAMILKWEAQLQERFAMLAAA